MGSKMGKGFSGNFLSLCEISVYFYVARKILEENFEEVLKCFQREIDKS